MSDPFGELRHRAAAASAYLPNLVEAAIILALGFVVAWIGGRAVSGALTKAGFDELGSRTGLPDDLARVGITMRPARLVGRIVFFVILATAFVQAVNGLELAPISASLAAFLTYLPHLVLAAALVLVGIIVGDLVGRGTARAMLRSGVLYHDIVGGILRTSIIVLSVLMALEQLTVASHFLFDVLLVVLGGVTLAVSIASGWSVRSFAENLVAARYVQRHLAIGEHVRVEGQVGRIERFDAMSTILRCEDGRRIIYPNALLSNSVVEAGESPLPPIPND